MTTIAEKTRQTKDDSLEKARKAGITRHRAIWASAHVMPVLAGFFNKEAMTSAFHTAKQLRRDVIEFDHSSHDEGDWHTWRVASKDMFIGEDEGDGRLVWPCYHSHGLSQGMAIYADLGDAAHVQFGVFVKITPDEPMLLVMCAANSYPKPHSPRCSPYLEREIPTDPDRNIGAWVDCTVREVFMAWYELNDVDTGSAVDLNKIMEDYTNE